MALVGVKFVEHAPGNAASRSGRLERSSVVVATTAKGVKVIIAVMGRGEKDERRG